MSYYENLPIFKKTIELNVYLDKIIRNFSRYHKYTLGTDIRSGAQKCLKLIVEANNLTNKVPSLIKLRIEFEQLKTLTYLGKEIQAFSNFKSFSETSRLVVECSKQVEGWLKHSHDKQQKKIFRIIPCS